jgi:2',3'-cyclic-nucleotide 2'-phosphodiesterase (5'-nucleotidase family)
MRYSRLNWMVVLGTALLLSCTTAFVPTKAVYDQQRITPSIPRDTAMVQLMEPYRDSVTRSMDIVVGMVEADMEKARPEGALGNFMVDAMLYGARQKFGTHVDAAFTNYGGIRITQLPKGPVTRGKIFELMPFDNLIVLQQVRGAALQQFLDLTAASGGWPVAGVTLQIKDKKAVNVQVGGQPLDPNKTYTIANSDYVANGGDEAAVFKNIPQQNKGYLLRDALFDYIQALKAQGKNISAPIENRVTNAQ